MKIKTKNLIELAITYIEDGAYHTAIDRLKEALKG